MNFNVQCVQNIIISLRSIRNPKLKWKWKSIEDEKKKQKKREWKFVNCDDDKNRRLYLHSWAFGLNVWESADYSNEQPHWNESFYLLLLLLLPLNKLKPCAKSIWMYSNEEWANQKSNWNLKWFEHEITLCMCMRAFNNNNTQCCHNFNSLAFCIGIAISHNEY